ncbi:transmembrane protein 106B-like [Cynoglossus semilaevis]|nr:transmembrane protein 106B-like [Cynoglossus semilaevis]
MGHVPSRFSGDRDHARCQHYGSVRDDDATPIIENDCTKRRRSTGRRCSGDTVPCPTCQGTGRIPRGQESKLVAVIPCTDQRLRPRHTKLYVALSVGVCLLISVLVLFFLFPRPVLLSPVTVESSVVFFVNSSVLINIVNTVNITNDNFVSVRAYSLSVQALDFRTVVGTVYIEDTTSVPPLSTKTISYMIPVNLTEPGKVGYCKSHVPVHILYLRLQMSLTIYYLAHDEQISQDAYKFINCGANSTAPHQTRLAAQ